MGLTWHTISDVTMPLFRITVKHRVNTNGVRLEPGMSVDVVTNSYSDPVHTNGGQCVADAWFTETDGESI